MDIYLLDTEKGQMAFVDFGSGYMICIGTRAEVDSASPAKLERMIWEAIAMSYRKPLVVPQTKHTH